MGSTEKECYCKFTAASCLFDYYTCTTSYPGTDPDASQVTMYQASSQLQGGFTVKTDTGFSKIKDCTLMTKMRKGLAFQMKVIVCGNE